MEVNTQVTQEKQVISLSLPYGELVGIDLLKLCTLCNLK